MCSWLRYQASQSDESCLMRTEKNLLTMCIAIQGIWLAGWFTVFTKYLVYHVYACPDIWPQTLFFAVQQRTILQRVDGLYIVVPLDFTCPTCPVTVT